MCVTLTERERESVCVCEKESVCVCVCDYVCLHACICVEYIGCLCRVFSFFSSIFKKYIKSEENLKLNNNFFLFIKFLFNLTRIS